MMQLAMFLVLLTMFFLIGRSPRYVNTVSHLIITMKNCCSHKNEIKSEFNLNLNSHLLFELNFKIQYKKMCLFVCLFNN